MNKFIHITPNVKVKSPFTLSNIEKYEGDICNINFHHQEKNYKLLSDSLAKFNLNLNYIWYAKFQTDSKHPIRVHFLARTENSEVFWRKYEAETQGSGQNFLYVNGYKFKLTDWFSFSEEKQKEIILKEFPNLFNHN